jgi:fibronectin-binding autotransporter adhesin
MAATGQGAMGETIYGHHSGVVLTNFTAENPVTIAANGDIRGTSAHGGDAIYGANHPWSLTNYGTVAGSGADSYGLVIANVTSNYAASLKNGGSDGSAALIEGGKGGVYIGTEFGAVLNFGTIEAMSGEGPGVRFADSSAVGYGGVRNYGAILGGVEGAESVLNGGSEAREALISGGITSSLLQGQVADVRNLATIVASGSTGIGVLSNDVYNGSGDALPSAALIAGYQIGVEIQGFGSVSNFGTIEATGSQGVGVEVVASGTFSAVIMNGGSYAETGVIEGARAGIYLSAGKPETVSNFGTIVATAPGGVGIIFAGDGTVIDAGTIAGGIAFDGTGNNLVIALGGAAISGAVSGSPGASNAVELEGNAGSPAIVDFDSFANFGTVTFAADANNAATLRIGDTTNLPGTITGFVALHDAIDLTALSDAHNDAKASFNAATGVLTVTGDNGSVALRFGGANYPGFTVANDGSGGSLVGLAASPTVFSGTYTNGVVLSPPQVQNPVTVTATGYVTNDGTANHGAAVYGSKPTVWTLANFGTIANPGSGGDGILLPGAGDIVNSGVILAGSAAAGISIAAASTVVNSGTIAGGTAGISLPLGTVTNSGLVEAGVTASHLTNSGTVEGGVQSSYVSNAAAGVIEGGVNFGFGSLLVNDGTVAGSVGGYGAVENFGTISGEISIPPSEPLIGGGGPVSNYGIIFGSLSGPTISNSGTIDATGSASFAAEALGGSARGGVLFPGTIQNLGTIVATGADSTGVRLSGGLSPAYLTNGSAGTISAVVEGDAVGVYSGSEFGALVTNYATITATGSDGIGIDLHGRATIRNYGLISGQAGVQIFNVFGSGAAAQTVSAAVVNYGTIVATGSNGVAFYYDRATLTNAGTIIGYDGTAVAFGGGHELLVVDPGAVFVGSVYAAGSGNTLELTAGAGTLSGLGSDFVGFAAVDVKTGANWTVSGGGSRFVNDGTIVAEGALVVKAVSGRGFVDVGGGNRAAFAARVGKHQRVVFTDAAGTLEIERPHAFEATIAGFAAGDTIDLVGKRLDALSYADHELVLTRGSHTVAELHFAGHYKASDFVLSPDGNGGTDISLSVRSA